MKAVQLVAVGKPLEERSVPIPEVGEGQVLVRIRAAGICHSDAHYRAGRSTMGKTPITLGHEIAGEIEEVGDGVKNVRAGDRVCVHYLLACGVCRFCRAGHEQFCATGSMIGRDVDGGFAEWIVVPERNAVKLPAEIPFAWGAAMMCSSATAFHALKKSRLQEGETVAIFGCGGLGLSAVQIARSMGAAEVFAVDVDDEKLLLAKSFGAVPIRARGSSPAADIRGRTEGRGVDVSVDLVGFPDTVRGAVESLGILGRAVMVGINSESAAIDAYRHLIGGENEIIGSNDHHLPELVTLLEMAQKGSLNLSTIVGASVPLIADRINNVLSSLEMYKAPARTVILPGST